MTWPHSFRVVLMLSIPRVLHFIWVGDEAKFPAACVETWRRNHPQYEIQVWGNSELIGMEWQNQRHIDQMLELKYPRCGVADLMRWEILGREGGIALDADSISLKPLPEWIFECNILAPWENEKERPRLVANGYVRARVGHPTFLRMVNMFSKKEESGEGFFLEEVEV